MRKKHWMLRYAVELAGAALLFAAPISGDEPDAGNALAAASGSAPRLVVFEDFSRPT